MSEVGSGLMKANVDVKASPPGRFVVRVPFPDGTTAVIDVLVDEAMDVYGISLSGELIDKAPEAITTACQLAFLAIREHRAERSS